VLRAEPDGALEQRRKLQVAVAVRARQRRPPARVLPHEVRDDGLLELPLEVDDVVGESEDAGDTPRVVEIVERATAPEFRSAVLGPALVVELHRQTDDVMTLLAEQGRGNGGIHAAGHGHDDPHSGFRFSILNS
jgi:hypothetical protein